MDAVFPQRRLPRLGMRCLAALPVWMNKETQDAFAKERWDSILETAC